MQRGAVECLGACVRAHVGCVTSRLPRTNVHTTTGGRGGGGGGGGGPYPRDCWGIDCFVLSGVGDLTIGGVPGVGHVDQCQCCNVSLALPTRAE